MIRPLPEMFDVDDDVNPPAKWIALAVYIKLPIVIAVIVALARGTI